MSFDLSRFIDKLEPDDSISSFLGNNNSKHFYLGVNETIKEEEDEEAI